MILRASLVVGAFFASPPVTAVAHAPDGEPVAMEDWWLAWSWQPLPLVGVLVAAVAYAIGLSRLWRCAGVGRGVARWQAGCFAGGIFTLLLAFVSPIDTLAGQLNWVHMVQHTLLMLVAAPLLVVGSPAAVLPWSLPNRLGRPVAHALHRLGLLHFSRYVLWQPLILWLAFTVILWIWHVPALYDLALRHQLVHDAQHLAFVLGACLYWRVALDPLGRVRLTPPVAVVYLFTMSLHGMILGVLMAFSPDLWYQAYAETTGAWGLSPVEDQQIAGYIMWKPACAIYALVAVVIFGLWLQRSVRGEEALAPPGPPPR